MFTQSSTKIVMIDENRVISSIVFFVAVACLFVFRGLVLQVSALFFYEGAFHAQPGRAKLLLIMFSLLIFTLFFWVCA